MKGLITEAVGRGMAVCLKTPGGSCLRLLPALLLSFILACCTKDDTILYDDQEMVEVRDGALVTDGGLHYAVTENLTDEGYLQEKRLFIRCDVLSRNSEDSYNVRLKDYVKVLCKKALLLSKTDLEETGSDTVTVRSAWTGGGYINVLASFPVRRKTAGKSRHIVNLVLDDGRSDRDSLFFNLRRKTDGEHFTKEEMETDSTIVRSDFFLSVPYLEFTDGGKPPSLIRISTERGGPGR